MPRLVLAAILLACGVSTAPAGPAEWVSRVRVLADPPKNGQVTYAVRFTPERTLSYEAITFECVYRQEFPWEDFKGRKFTKVLEPVIFTFRRAAVSFVAELDADVNFQVPVDYATLADKYGPTTFNKDYPITINRIRITAVVAGAEAWQVELPGAGGDFDMKALPAETEAETAK